VGTELPGTPGPLQPRWQHHHDHVGQPGRALGRGHRSPARPRWTWDPTNVAAARPPAFSAGRSPARRGRTPMTTRSASSTSRPSSRSASRSAYHTASAAPTVFLPDGRLVTCRPPTKPLSGSSTHSPGRLETTVQTNPGGAGRARWTGALGQFHARWHRADQRRLRPTTACSPWDGRDRGSARRPPRRTNRHRGAHRLQPRRQDHPVGRPRRHLHAVGTGPANESWRRSTHRSDRPGWASPGIPTRPVVVTHRRPRLGPLLGRQQPPAIPSSSGDEAPRRACGLPYLQP